MNPFSIPVCSIKSVCGCDARFFSNSSTGSLNVSHSEIRAVSFPSFSSSS